MIVEIQENKIEPQYHRKHACNCQTPGVSCQPREPLVSKARCKERKDSDVTEKGEVHAPGTIGALSRERFTNSPKREPRASEAVGNISRTSPSEEAKERIPRFPRETPVVHSLARTRRSHFRFIDAKEHLRTWEPQEKRYSEVLTVTARTLVVYFSQQANLSTARTT